MIILFDNKLKKVHWIYICCHPECSAVAGCIEGL